MHHTGGNRMMHPTWQKGVCLFFSCCCAVRWGVFPCCCVFVSFWFRCSFCGVARLPWASTLPVHRWWIRSTFPLCYLLFLWLYSFDLADQLVECFDELVFLFYWLAEEPFLILDHACFVAGVGDDLVFVWVESDDDVSADRVVCRVCEELFHESWYDFEQCRVGFF